MEVVGGRKKIESRLECSSIARRWDWSEMHEGRLSRLNWRSQILGRNRYREVKRVGDAPGMKKANKNTLMNCLVKDCSWHVNCVLGESDV